MGLDMFGQIRHGICSTALEYSRVTLAFLSLLDGLSRDVASQKSRLNAINLTNVRQTRFDPLIPTTPGLGGTPITEVWAPLDGRTFNVGIRLNL